MLYAVRVQWETKEKLRKEPSVGEQVRLIDAASETAAREAGLAWHAAQGFGGTPKVLAVDAIGGQDRPAETRP